MNFYLYLSVTVFWADDDVCLTEIRACNGQFAGTTEVYFPTGGLAALAGRLSGFPKTVSQKEVCVMGAPMSGRSAELTFYCVGGVGRAAVAIGLRRDDECVEMKMAFEPEALACFCRELTSVEAGTSRQAVLLGEREYISPEGGLK